MTQQEASRRLESVTGKLEGIVAQHEKRLDRIDEFADRITSLECVADKLEKTADKFETIGNRVTALETRHDETHKSSTRSAQWWGAVSGLLVFLLGKLWDYLTGQHPK